MEWCSGSTCIVVYGLIPWNNFYFSSCGKYELILRMNSYLRWIQYEFIYFLHFKYMNSYEYEFILCMNSYTFCSYHVWINIFFAVWIHILYEFMYFLQLSCMNSYIFLQCKIKAASAREPQARSASREGKARAHLLPRQGRAQLPQPLGLRAAAPIVRVVRGCPDS